MLGVSFFRRKPRQFNYSPRYYDAEAEAREERKRLILGEDYDKDYKADDKGYTPGKYIRRAQVHRMKGNVSTKDKGRNIMVRLIIFIVLLLIAAYYIISYDGFAKILGL